MKFAKSLIASAVGVSAVVLPLASHAAIDIAAVTTGITDAQTAVLAIIAALLAMSTAIFGLVKVYSFVRRKAGA